MHFQFRILEYLVEHLVAALRTNQPDINTNKNHNLPRYFQINAVKISDVPNLWILVWFLVKMMFIINM